jgi:peroxiredoxin
MPDWIISKSHDSLLGDRVTDYYTESHYFNYKFNQGDIDITSMTVPKEYHTPKAQPPMPVLLVPGTVAPKWTLYAADGKQMSLAQMKGKVVMLDFFFIGCGGCMLSLKPLNQLYQIYKNQNMEIASMAFRDSKQSVLDFESNYHIKYPTYLNAADEVASYHVNGFPTFYFIDKEGKIASVIVGYTDDFEQKAASIIDGLLKQ